MRIIVIFLSVYLVALHRINAEVTISNVEADFNEDLVQIEATVKEVNGESVADIDLNVLKVINGVLFELSINLEMGDDYVEVWHSKTFDPCAGAEPTESPMQYFLGQMAKYGSKLNPCPMKPEVRSLKNFKFDEDGMPVTIMNGPNGNVRIDFIAKKKSDGEEFFVKSFYVVKS